MATPKILTAATIITMDDAHPTATAVAVAADGTIAAVGDVAACQAVLGADAAIVDLGSTVLAPGFVESHSHPLLAGLTTQSPAIWIAPYVGYPTFADVEALWHRIHAERPAGDVLVFMGLDKLLHGCEAPTADSLEQYFPGRAVLVGDNSGHAMYVSHTYLKGLGWDTNPPADPPAAHFGRNPDGSLNGQAYETAAVMQIAAYALAHAGINPIASGAEWYALMARNGITSATEHAYGDMMKAGYEALATMPGAPLRISLYHISTEDTCGDTFETAADPDMLHKTGIKLWADGSPWVGNVALSFPYLDTPTTRAAGITLDTGGEQSMNYSRAQIQAIVDRYAGTGWQLSIHLNGDVAFDIVMDVFEQGLRTAGLLGTDHRWRVEHLGAAQAHQFARAAALGLKASMGPFQFTYWGDLLDGQMFPHEIGAQWQRVGDATAAGLHVCFHNDGMVSPPDPIRNIHTVTTRQTRSGAVHGPEQKIDLHEALKGQTIYAAQILRREHNVGSIEVGKLADFVELSADPYTVDPETFNDSVAVQGTWLGGERVDLAAFLHASGVTDPAEYANLTSLTRTCC